MAQSGPVELSQAVKILREKAGMSQDSLAAASGLTGNAIGRIETGTTRSPYASTLLKIARVCGHGSWPDALASLSDDPEANTSDGFGVPVLPDMPASWNPDDDGSLFAMRLHGDAMATRYPDGAVITCSPAHWADHGFVDGSVYAVRLPDGEIEVSRVCSIAGSRIEFSPDNPAHARRIIALQDVQYAALVRGVYSMDLPPDISQHRRRRTDAEARAMVDAAHRDAEPGRAQTRVRAWRPPA